MSLWGRASMVLCLRSMPLLMAPLRAYPPWRPWRLPVSSWVQGRANPV